MITTYPKRNDPSDAKTPTSNCPKALVSKEASVSETQIFYLVCSRIYRHLREHWLFFFLFEFQNLERDIAGFGNLFMYKCKCNVA